MLSVRVVPQKHVNIVDFINGRHVRLGSEPLDYFLATPQSAFRS
jgi:hypothetical protein